MPTFMRSPSSSILPVPSSTILLVLHPVVLRVLPSYHPTRTISVRCYAWHKRLANARYGRRISTYACGHAATAA
eukprot:2313346-Rhodomonas_salina.1